MSQHGIDFSQGIDLVQHALLLLDHCFNRVGGFKFTQAGLQVFKSLGKLIVQIGIEYFQRF